MITIQYMHDEGGKAWLEARDGWVPGPETVYRFELRKDIPAGPPYALRNGRRVLVMQLPRLIVESALMGALTMLAVKEGDAG